MIAKTGLATVLILAATALPAAAEPQDRGRDATYSASGTEPFWRLTITPRTMRFEAAGRRSIDVAKPPVSISFNGENYATREMVVRIDHVACRDGMSDRRYPDTVTVTTGRTVWNGCGGTPVEQPRQTIEGRWTIEAINGLPVAPRSDTFLRFERGELTGRAGCNNFSTQYRFEQGRLHTGTLTSTRMACVPAQMAQEQAVMRILGGRLTVSTNRAGKLVMTTRTGETLTLVPVRR